MEIKERNKEQQYSHLLSCPNISDHFKYPETVNKISKAFDKSLLSENTNFQDLKAISTNTFETLRHRKWFKDLSPEEERGLRHDVTQYVAKQIWDCKRVSGNIQLQEYWRLANLKHFTELSRKFAHEATNRSLKTIKPEINDLLGDDKDSIQRVLSLLETTLMKTVEMMWTQETNQYSLPNYDQFRARPQLNYFEEDLPDE